MSEEKYLLSELQQKIQDVLENGLEYNYHIIAEISSVQESHNGHAYLELVEKNPKTEQVQAKARATIWSYTYRMLKPYFQSITGENLKDGMKISLTAEVKFHPVYGISLNVTDIDPEYTLGDIERQRLEVIRQLEDEGVINMNKELQLVDVPQKIALISSETAAGYEDFMTQIQNNDYGYSFDIELFSAIMQGNKAPESIVQALDAVNESSSEFDVVVIVRGGGSKSDLACFDDYWPAVNIAQFPLPIISGIGHERDTSVVDLTAHTQVKTPTAAAEFLIDRFFTFESQLDNLYSDFTKTISHILASENQKLILLTSSLSSSVNSVLQRKKMQLENLHSAVQSESNYFLKIKESDLAEFVKDLQYTFSRKLSEKERSFNMIQYRLKVVVDKFLVNRNTELEKVKNRITALDPNNILKLGYSYTKRGSKTISDASELQKGEEIVTYFYKGKATSVIDRLL